MKRFTLAILILPIVSQLMYGQTGDFNKTYRIKTVYNSASQVSSTDPEVINQSIIYYDILGREEQAKLLNYAPDGDVLIQPFVYDQFGNRDKSYLPYTNTTSSYFDPNSATNQSSFYQNTSLVAHDPYPFVSVEYDNSPSKFVRSGKTVGDFWQNAANVNNKISVQKIGNDLFDSSPVDLMTNIDVVRKWINTSLGCISTSDYSANQLSGFVSQSPEHAYQVVFKDKLGKVICSKTLNNSSNKVLTTYYIYNELGNIEYVVPPKAFYQLEVLGTYDLSLLTEDLIYKYKYDEKGRLIEKKIPGKQVIEVVYDNLNRIILQNNGNLRAENKWVFYKYDVLNRILTSGTYKNTTITTRAAMQSAANTHYINQPSSESKNGTNYSTLMGYSNVSFPYLVNNLIDYEILTAYYYDDYDFNSDGTDNSAYIDLLFSTDHKPAFNNKNRLTSKKSKIIGGSGYITDVYFYQFNENKLIQMQSNNAFGGFDITNYKTNFLGQPVKVEHSKNYGGTPSHTIKNRYTYDHQNRLRKSYEKIDNNPEVVLSEMAYNKIGQPIIKKLHSMYDNGNYLQNINFEYHINGNLTKINNPQTLGITNPTTLISTFSSEAIINIVSTTDEEFLADNDVAKYFANTEVSNYQFTIQEVSVSRSQSNLNVHYVDNKTFTITTDVNLPTHETAVLTSTESYGKLLLTGDGSNTAMYNILKELNNVTLNISFETPISNFSGDVFYNLSKAQIEDYLDEYNITDANVINFLTAAVTSKIQSSAEKFIQVNTENDMFGMDIIYDTPQFPNATAKHNGFISELHWKSKSDEKYRGYTFQFDDIEQLTEAKYAVYNSVNDQWNNQVDRYNLSNVTYDYNGNIKTLNRKGIRDNGTFGDIDLLNYSYTGNQLVTVDDSYNAVPVTTDFEDNGSYGVTEYLHDNNGNITTDDNKNITVFYNILDLPRLVDFGNGKQLIYKYSASGKMLEKKVVWAGNPVYSVQYNGRFIYENNSTLTSILTAEGRAIPEITIGQDYRYEYNYKDHLGNVRLIFSDLDGNGKIKKEEIIQENHYYPFGGELNGLNTTQVGPENHYKFNGNELQPDEGLNWYNFNARFYMPDLGRFTSIDPLAEYTANWTPYRFGFNNPISFNDPSGLCEWCDDDDVGDGHYNEDGDRWDPQIELFQEHGGNGSSRLIYIDLDLEHLFSGFEGGSDNGGNLNDGFDTHYDLEDAYNDNGRDLSEQENNDQGNGRELSKSDIQNLSQQLGRRPSGQDVIDFISKVNSNYPNAVVTGKTLQESVNGITKDARASLGNIVQVTKEGNNIKVSGGTQIKIFPTLNLKIANDATFTISEINESQVVINVQGIKVGWFNFNEVIINPSSVTINIGGIYTSFDLK